MPGSLLRLAGLLVASSCCLVSSAVGAGTAEPAFELELGVGTARSPDYSGSSSHVAQMRLWANGTLRTAELGTFALDSGSLTIDPECRWNFVDTPDVGLGVLVGYRPGRDDRKPTFFGWNSGSEALRGLPTVPPAIDLGAQGYVAVYGLPLFAQIRSAVGGAQGTLVIIGAFATFSVGADAEMTVLPTATWADARQMRAFYGVGVGASAASGFSPYAPGAGWQNTALEFGGDWRIVREWHLVASIAYERLLGEAAGSPIVGAKNQLSGLIGIAWHY
jgi:outer membrane scaffolding protein for murein synthesis (MipA/OmpV family)